jgi:hypothetical protein
VDAPKPFPTDEPIRPEERLIGRRSHLDELEARLLRRRTNTRLAGARRIGKTSVGQAICDRARARGDWWVLEADLSKHGPINDAAGLAEHLAEAARTAGIRVRRPQAGPLRKTVNKAAALACGAPKTGVEEIDSLVSAAAAVDAALAPKESAQPEDLRKVLEAVTQAARSADRHVLLFVDEAQRLAPMPVRAVQDWSSPEDSELVQNVLAEVMRDDDPGIVVLLAGSERRLMESLFSEGAPMEYLGTRYDLPAIGREDWLASLRRRFVNELGLRIEDREIEAILAATGGHPRNTMQVCEEARAFAESDVGGEITALAVENAIRTVGRAP